MESIDKSIENFIHELNTRIELFKSSKIKENVDENKIQPIIDIIRKYTDKDILDLTVLDLEKFTSKDIINILKNTDLKSVSSLFDDTNLIENDQYEIILKKIKNYYNQYKTININQDELINDKISLYEKYIDLLKNKKYSLLFANYEELIKVMAEVRVENEDRWQILKAINEDFYTNSNGNEFNLCLNVNKQEKDIEEFLKDEEILANIIELFKTELDYELIETYAENVANKINKDKNVIYNIIAVEMASNLLAEYEKIEELSDKELLKNIIIELLKSLKVIHTYEYYRAKDIIGKTTDFYEDAIISNIDIKKYLDISLSEIEEITGDFNASIDLKELPIIEQIRELVNNMDINDKDTEEYNKKSSVLKKLNELYYELEEKRNKEKVRIN